MTTLTADILCSTEDKKWSTRFMLGVMAIANLFSRGRHIREDEWQKLIPLNDSTLKEIGVSPRTIQRINAAAAIVKRGLEM
jgi:hypothetical protein